MGIAASQAQYCAPGTAQKNERADRGNETKHKTRKWRRTAPGLIRQKISAAMKAPSTMPTISGRKYCTIGAFWRPIAPAMSRLKQTTQMPMLPGFPECCNHTASAPKASQQWLRHLVWEKNWSGISFVLHSFERFAVRCQAAFRSGRAEDILRIGVSEYYTLKTPAAKTPRRGAWLRPSGIEERRCKKNRIHSWKAS